MNTQVYRLNLNNKNLDFEYFKTDEKHSNIQIRNKSLWDYKSNQVK